MELKREIMSNNLRKKIYDMSNSFLPLDMFYNDIENMSKYPSFNSENAFKDLEKIANFILDLQQQLADTKAKLETAEYWNNKYDDCQQQLTITEKALELACKKVEERYTCSELAEGYGCNLNYFKIKAREMLENE